MTWETNLLSCVGNACEGRTEEKRSMASFLFVSSYPAAQGLHIINIYIYIYIYIYMFSPLP